MVNEVGKRDWSGTESNRRHEDFQSSALPTELPDHQTSTKIIYRLNMSTRNSFFITVFILFFLVPDGEIVSQELLKESSDFYLRRGAKQYKAEMYSFAVESLRLALIKEPGKAEASELLGDVYLKMGRIEEAHSLYLNAAASNESTAQSHYKLSVTFERLGDVNSAFSSLQKCLSLDAGYAPGLTAVVRHYYRRGEHESYLSAISRARLATEAQYRPHLDRGLELFRQGKLAQAEVELQRAVELCPVCDEAFITLASLYRAGNNFTAAVETLEKLLKSLPGCAPGYFHLASILVNKPLPGKRVYFLRKSLALMKQAVKIEPDNSEYLINLAGIYRQLGNHDMAELTTVKALNISDGKSGK